MKIKDYKYIFLNFKFLRHIYYNIYNQKFLNFKNLNLNTNSIVLDIGANLGEITHYVYDNYKCNIYCYEPNKKIFKILNHYFKNNDKIKCFNFAISDKNGFANLYLHNLINKNSIKYSTASSMIKQKDNINSKNFYKVKTSSILEIINQFNYIDLIKIDIEGHEYEILPEIIKNKNKIKRVICELHGNPDKNKNNFLNNKYKNFIEELKEIDPEKKWFISHY